MMSLDSFVVAFRCHATTLEKHLHLPLTLYEGGMSLEPRGAWELSAMQKP